LLEQLSTVQETISNNNTDDENSSDIIYDSTSQVNNFYTCFMAKKVSFNLKNNQTESKEIILWGCTSISDDVKYILDSGCSQHMIPIEFETQNNQPCKAKVTFGVGSKMCKEKGDFTFNTSINENSTIILYNCLKVEGLRVVLVSLCKLLQDNYSVTINSTGGNLYGPEGNLIAIITVSDAIFVIDTSTPTHSYYVQVFNKLKSTKFAGVANIIPENTMDLWHCRMGHLNSRDLIRLQKLSEGVIISKTNIKSLCSSCCQAKSTRKPFKNEGKQASRIFQYIYADIVGPYPIPTPNGYRYWLGLTDKFSDHDWTYLLQHKSEAASNIISFIKSQEVRDLSFKNGEIIFFSTDNGGEFISEELETFLEEKCISHQLQPAYTPEYNAIRERKNRTQGEMADAMLFYSGLPQSCWGLAILYANYIRNRCPTSSNPNFKTPYEMLYGVKPDLSHIKIFGSPCYYHIPKQLRKKLQPKSMPGIIVGYEPLKRSYKIIPLHKPEQIIFSRDIICDEAVLVKRFLSTSFTPSINKNYQEYTPVNIPKNNAAVQPSQPIPIDNEQQKKTRSGKCYQASNSIEPDLFWAYKGIVDIHSDEPKNLKAALESEDSEMWIQAIRNEIEILEQHETWYEEPIQCPNDQNPINCSFIFKKKFDDRGNLIKYKARLVAKGYNQQQGVDFIESFSPVVEKSTIRIFLEIAASKNMKLLQFDVPSAFTLADLKEEVFIKLPTEFFPSGKNKVFKLKKALYGLRQSPLAFFNHLKDKFEKINLKQNQKDPCFFYENSSNSNDILSMAIVHVDDGLIAVPTREKEEEYKKYFKYELSAIFSERIESYLGIEISRISPSIITIKQKSYIAKLCPTFFRISKTVSRNSNEAKTKART
jgi:hypothetical protein